MKQLKAKPPETTPQFDLDWSDIAVAVFQSKGIKSGLWRVGIRLQFAGITGEWLKREEEGLATSLPTGLMGIAGLALFKTDQPAPMVFDAATGKEVKGVRPALEATRAPRTSRKKASPT